MRKKKCRKDTCIMSLLCVHHPKAYLYDDTSKYWCRSGVCQLDLHLVILSTSWKLILQSLFSTVSAKNLKIWVRKKQLRCFTRVWIAKITAMRRFEWTSFIPSFRFLPRILSASSCVRSPGLRTTTTGPSSSLLSGSESTGPWSFVANLSWRVGPDFIPVFCLNCCKNFGTAGAWYWIFLPPLMMILRWNWLKMFWSISRCSLYRKHWNPESKSNRRRQRK